MNSFLQAPEIVELEEEVLAQVAGGPVVINEPEIFWSSGRGECGLA